MLKNIPISQCTPSKPSGHLHEAMPPLLRHIPEFRHGVGLQTSAGSLQVRPFQLEGHLQRNVDPVSSQCPPLLQGFPAQCDNPV